MNIISPSQCRAARGLLNWSQPDLAKRSDVHVQTICAFENETGTPTARTQKKLLQAFQKLGINFTLKGIEQDEFPVFFTEGKTHEEAYLQLIEDAFDHLQNRKNPELLIMYADDRVSPPSVNNFYRKMRAAGIQMRQLIE